MSNPLHNALGQKPWHFNYFEQKAEPQGTKGYQILTASKEDMDRVVTWYSHHPAKGLVLKQVSIIHNPQMARGFESRVALLEKRYASPAFTSKWKEETKSTTDKEQRELTATLLTSMTHSHQDTEHPHVSLVPLWHGTKTQLLDSLFETGYANLATTDDGYFGKGLYNTGEAEYAHRVYSQGALIVNWVAFYSAFPVIRADMEKLKGKGTYQNYDAHFAPVVPRSDSPHEVVYYPCQPGQTHTYTELVVFDSAQVLPRYLVELQPALPASPFSSNSNSSSSLKVNDLLEALLVYQDTLDANSEEYQCIESKITLYGTQNRSLNEKEIGVYNLAKRIEGAGETQKKLFGKKMLASLQAMNENDLSISSGPVPQQYKQLPNTPLIVGTHKQQNTASPLLSVSNPIQISNPPVIASVYKQPAQPSIPTMAFGKAEWEKHIGDVGIAPPLPSNIDKTLQSPCPFWPGKKVHETHLLTLIPKTVNGKPLTLISLEELIKAPKQGNATKYSYFDLVKQEHGNTPVPSSYWVLMTRDVIEGSRNKTYSDHCKLVESAAKKTGLPYALPRAIEATASILMHYVRTKEYLYTNDKTGKQWTFTHCQEKVDNNKWPVAIGGFAPAGLRVSFSYAYGSDDDGVAGAWKF